MATTSSESQLNKDLDYLTTMARRIGLKGEDARKYVYEHMTRLGYEPEMSYRKARKSDNGNGNDSGFSFLGGTTSRDDEDE